MISAIVRFCLERKLVVALLMAAILGWGVLVAPFAWDVQGLPRDPVPVDAIPDIGENQQIVFTEWMGRSPQDVQDQVTYPLTVALLGVPGVRSVRSYSFFGFSSIYVIFEDGVDFYWSRSRVLEKLSSLPAGTLPADVQPALGPDATALGQVFWYTLEGHDPQGRVVGGWGLDELRSIQDWQVRYALLSASTASAASGATSNAISEVASIGGFVREYQVDVDPDALHAHGVSLTEVVAAVRGSNLDVGARTIELNRVEYVVRGLGFVREVADLEQVVVKVADNVPIRVRDVARVGLGPALRRGVLDKDGAEAVGGVVVVRYGANPLAAIEQVKAAIANLAPSLPRKVLIDRQAVDRAALEAFAVRKGFRAFDGDALDQAAWVRWATQADALPPWLVLSQVTIVPFYDRTGLIHETLGTLSTALTEEILISIIVVIAMVLHLRSSLLISGLLPLAVLICFIAMKLSGVDANVVALSGIAIAIGTMVDVGIVLCENILRHLDEAPPDEPRIDVIHRAAVEVGGAVVTAIATTVISFLPVFAMEAAEGKLFRPLAFTKTFALLGSVVVGLAIIPPAAHLLFGRIRPGPRGWHRWVAPAALGALAVAALWLSAPIGLGLGLLAAVTAGRERLPERARPLALVAANTLVALGFTWVLAVHWSPLGAHRGDALNLLFTAGLVGGLLGAFLLFQRAYPALLRWCLANKVKFLLAPAACGLLGLTIWLGAPTVFGWVPQGLRESRLGWAVAHAFPGLGEEFMPRLDEGSFLYMPVTMPHASIGEAQDVLRKLDRLIAQVPEVEQAVGKIGRAESALDPAPISMIETIVNVRSEYVVDAAGRRLRFAYDAERGEYLRDEAGELVPDPSGRPFRQWRDEVRTIDDVWDEIAAVARIPGTTATSRLQPIEGRIVMLQSGMRAPMGVKVLGPDLESIERAALEIERRLKEVPGVAPATVVAERVVGKPYLEIDIDRAAIARHGLKIRQIQDLIEVAIGGRPLTQTVEGRERYPVRVRYPRELRDSVEAIAEVAVPTPDGHQIPLAELADLRYVRGPQAIKSEDTFLVGYVLFDKRPGLAEVDVVEACREHLAGLRRSGELTLPAGVELKFAGSYENQVRSEQKLRVLLPVALLVIFLILYLQFSRVSTTLMVFVGIAVAWSGGFVMLWLYGQPWFLDVELLGVDLRALFSVGPINLSVAVWVGFIALFGIATDDGVVIATYLDQEFERTAPSTVEEVRAATARAGERRIRPCLMTTATTILALIPILTSTGRGADIMVPMAIPSFGGMCLELLTLFVVPTLYCAWAERGLRARTQRAARAS